MVSVLRPGQRILNIPGIGMSTSRRAVASAAAWWAVTGKTCVAAYQPKGAASLAASYVNLVNPGTYDAAPGTAPSFDATTGWTFNGSNQYLRVVLGSITTAVTIIARYSGAVSGFTAMVGSAANGGWSRIALSPKFAGTSNNRNYRHGGTNNAGAGGDAAGVMAIAAGNGYYNGLSDAGPWTAAVASPNIGIGAYYDPTGYWAGSMQAMAIYSDTLTAGEIATLHAAMAAL